MRMVPFKGIIIEAQRTSLRSASGFCRGTIQRSALLVARIVLGEIQANLHRQHVFRLESRIYVLEFLETSQHQSRANEKQNETATWATISRLRSLRPCCSSRCVRADSVFRTHRRCARAYGRDGKEARAIDDRRAAEAAQPADRCPGSRSRFCFSLAGLMLRISRNSST